jgi:hypothetical protein
MRARNKTDLALLPTRTLFKVFVTLTGIKMMFCVADPTHGGGAAMEGRS